MDTSSFNLETPGVALSSYKKKRCPTQEECNPVERRFHSEATLFTQLQSRKTELQHHSVRQIGFLETFYTWIHAAEYDLASSKKFNEAVRRSQGKPADTLSSKYFRTAKNIKYFYGDPDSRNSLVFVQLFSDSPHFKKLRLTYDEQNEVLLHATADFIKGCAYFDPSVVFSKIMGAGEEYIHILTQKKELLDEVYIKNKLPLPLIVSLTDCSWDCCKVMMTDQCKTTNLLEELYGYLMMNCIPCCINSLLFLEDPSSSSACEIYQKLKPDLFMYGEEFEYYTAISIKSKTALADFEKLIITWKEKLEEKLIEIGVPSSAVQLKLLKGEYGESENFYEVLDIQIGQWHARVFPDKWEDMRLLEVNVSPYKIGQKFKVGNTDYPVDLLFTKFITEISREMKLNISSGHKHIDLRQSIGGNPELLFRMLVDVEDKAWLGRCFKTETYSDKTRKYVVQGEQGQKTSNMLGVIIEAFNELLGQGRTSKGGDFFKTNKPIREFWSRLLGNDPKRYIPVNLRLDNDVDNQEARLGHIVSHPNNTAEFRFFNCPRSGDEALLISRLLEAWFIKISKEQESGVKVDYTPCDPLVRINTPELKSKYRHFIESLGLNPDEYEKLLWI